VNWLELVAVLCKIPQGNSIEDAKFVVKNLQFSTQSIFQKSWTEILE